MSGFWKVCSFLCTQYLVGPPFAWITASMQRDMESISLWHCSGVMEAQVALIAAFMSSALLGLVSLIFLLTIPLQASRVRPNFSRVRLTKIPGRTGASSHSRKEKKVSATQKLNKRHLYRGLNQSEIVKGGPPLWLAVVQIFLYVCVRVDKCVTCAAAVRQRERAE